jgi:hypothetical protein
MLLNARKTMPKGSELAVITAEFVDILPRDRQTPAMETWVGNQLANGNSVSDLVDYFKNNQDKLGIHDRKIGSLESSLARQGLLLDNHIKYTDQRFEAVNNKVSELQTQLAVTTALSNERSQQQAQTNNQLFGSLNQTNQNLVQGLTTVAAKSSGSTNYVTLAIGLIFGVIVVSCMVSLVEAQYRKPAKDVPTQIIEYKQVPSNGHPVPIPKEQYDKL